ncbi:MAG: hypothetical protein HKN45_01750, partial [Flavobacteriales bacterium]|nr:hypothetical protein [Flavobacteriales bacterium]
MKSRSLWASILYFFPFQLLILHFKKNHLLILFWFLLFGYVSGGLATKYGVSFLFLYPEYLGEVGFWSHLMIGFAMAGFVTAFNIYSYVIHAFRFRFLATLSRPFYKFSINNFLIPGVFIGYYIFKAIAFQRTIELESTTDIILHITGFVIGFFSFMMISLLYFYGTNKDVLGFLKNDKNQDKGRFGELYDKFIRERIRQSTKRLSQRPWRVETYLKNPFTIVLARDSEHYNEETLRRVFRQNHFNASMFELFLVLTFLVVMNFGDLPVFTIPGGASVILVFTLMLMILSVLLSWFRGWAVTVLVLVVLVANYFSNDLTFLPQQNPLYGLDYSLEINYDSDVLQSELANETINEKEKKDMEAVLDKWLANQRSLGIDRPKLFIINSSGGGLRSSLWNTTILCHIDSVMGGDLMKKATLMSGASGGMLGLAFLRETYIQNEFKEIYTRRESMERDIAKDILNPVLLSIASTDLFFQLGSFTYNGMDYPKDRAYRFEEQYLSNTGNHLDKSLSDYRALEASAQIPMLIIYPTIINDGRKLLVSPLDMGFMNPLP